MTDNLCDVCPEYRLFAGGRMNGFSGNVVKINFFHMGMSVADVALRFMGIYQAQFRGLEEAGGTGVEVKFTLDKVETGADVVVCSANSADLARAARESERKLVVYVPTADLWFDEALLGELRMRVLFVYGTFLSETTEARYRELGIAYRQLPFGADPELMRPLGLAPQYDVVFLGGLHHRRSYQPYVEPLLKKIDLRRTLFIGGGWQKYGIPAQSVAYGPLVNVLYNLGRVCINLHAPEQCRGRREQLDANNRLFDLAMAGCVQVSDNPEAVRMHFDEGEVYAESTAGAWVERVMECLARPEEDLIAIRRAARARALAEHTWKARGASFLAWARQHSAE
jgi:hypothetical protein